jgi:hypothetical protein
MTISVFTAPVSNKGNFKQYSWPEMAKLLTGPPVVLPDNKSETKAKFGAYFLRGRSIGPRCDDNLQDDCPLLILDIDKALGKSPLPTPLVIHRALKGLQHAVYSTATPGRCRIVFHVAPYHKDDTDLLTWAAYQYCLRSGLKFAYAGESATKSQPWFLPQTTDPAKHAAYGQADGTLFQVSMAGELPPMPRQKKETVALDAPEEGTGHNHLESFIAELQTGTVHEVAKTYAGWMSRTTNLSCRQIFDQITTIVNYHCADPEKIQRWNSGERAALEKWFRENAVNDALTAPARRFTFSPVAALLTDQQPVAWLVKGFLEQDTLATLFGPPETLKTFIALSLGLAIATGRDWYGNEVKHAGPVLYLCGEGQRGIARRVKAWLIRNQEQTPPFYVSSGPAALLDAMSLAAVETAAAEIPDGPPVLIIVDTLNRNFGNGDENSTSDMTRFVAALDRLKARFGCAVLLVHHTGLAATDRGRGNSSLHGAVDFQYTVKRESDTVILSCSKAKDHERPADLAFTPRVVELGDLDDDGLPLTSLILNPTDAPERKFKLRLPPAQRIALDALASLGGSAHLDKWRAEAYAAGISDTPNGKRQAFNRARTALLTAGIIATRDDDYSIVKAPLHSVTKRDIVTGCNVTLRDTTLKGVTHVTPPNPEGKILKMSRSEPVQGEYL